MARTAEENRFQRAAIAKFIAGQPADAPIRAIVASEAVQKTLTAFEVADDAALAAQARYRCWGRRGLRATTLGIIIGALLLLPLDQWFDGKPRLIVGGLQTLALVFTFAAILLIRWLKPLDQWLTHRAGAEQWRGRLFSAIVNAPAPAGTTAAVLTLQKLDLLTAAHINDQLQFLDDRAGAHRKVASLFSPIRIAGYLLILCAAVLGLAALINAAGVPIPDSLRWLVDVLVLPDANRWQLGITTMASGILAHATARSLMEEDERKAELYTVTAQKLRRLVERDLGKVQAAAARGDEAALKTYFKDARTIMEQEHAVWSFIRPADDAPSDTSDQKF